jgi:hypothetical protein
MVLRMWATFAAIAWSCLCSLHRGHRCLLAITGHRGSCSISIVCPSAPVKVKLEESSRHGPRMQDLRVMAWYHGEAGVTHGTQTVRGASLLLMIVSEDREPVIV